MLPPHGLSDPEGRQGVQGPGGRPLGMDGSPRHTTTKITADLEKAMADLADLRHGQPRVTTDLVPTSEGGKAGSLGIARRLKGGMPSPPWSMSRSCRLARGRAATRVRGDHLEVRHRTYRLTPSRVAGPFTLP